MPARPASLFVSYAREDEQFLRALKTQLAALERAGHAEIWSDSNLRAGADFEQEISERLEGADVIVLLVTPDFIASSYCYEREMKRALELHEMGQARTIPVIVRPSLWELAPFANLQVLPPGGVAITSWDDPDQGWLAVARGILAAIETLAAREAASREDAESQTRRLRADPTSAVPRNADDETKALVLRFLENYPRWGFNVQRILKWGSRKPGFERLGTFSAPELRRVLDELHAAGVVKVFPSTASRTRLYKI